MVNGFLLAPKDGGMKYYYRKIFNIVKIVCVFTFILIFLNLLEVISLY